MFLHISDRHLTGELEFVLPRGCIVLGFWQVAKELVLAPIEELPVQFEISSSQAELPTPPQELTIHFRVSNYPVNGEAVSYFEVCLSKQSHLWRSTGRKAGHLHCKFCDDKLI